MGSPFQTLQNKLPMTIEVKISSWFLSENWKIHFKDFVNVFSQIVFVSSSNKRQYSKYMIQNNFGADSNFYNINNTRFQINFQTKFSPKRRKILKIKENIVFIIEQHFPITHLEEKEEKGEIPKERSCYWDDSYFHKGFGVWTRVLFRLLLISSSLSDQKVFLEKYLRVMLKAHLVYGIDLTFNFVFLDQIE